MLLIEKYGEINPGNPAGIYTFATKGTTITDTNQANCFQITPLDLFFTWISRILGITHSLPPLLNISLVVIRNIPANKPYRTEIFHVCDKLNRLDS